MPAEIVIVADIWVRPEHEERVLELLRDDIEHTYATFRNAGLRVAGTELISNESAEVTGELKAGRYTFFCTRRVRGDDGHADRALTYQRKAKP